MTDETQPQSNQEQTKQREGISYSQMIWEEFSKQIENWIGLLLTLFFFLLTFIAPLLSSRYPFYWKRGDHVQYPWFVDFFNPTKIIDFFYNMSFLALLVTGLILLVIWGIKSSSWSRSQFFKISSLLFVSILGINLFLFSSLEFKRGDLSQTDYKEIYEQNPEEINALFALHPYSHTGTNVNQTYRSLFEYPIPEPLKQKVLDNRPELRMEPEEKQYQKIVQSEAFQKYHKKHPYTTAIHWLGTDEVGGDILSRVLYGTRASLAVGFVATILSIGIGVFLGALAGYFSGIIDMLISRSLEVVIMFPRIMLIISILAFVKNRELMLFYIMIIIGLIGWPGTCRLIRNTCLQTREEEYITAARSLGGGNFRIIFKHVLPNSMSPLFVSAPFAIAGGILLEGGLGLIGFTGNYPSWGKILNQGYGQFPEEAYLVLVPVTGIFLAVTAYNLIGAGLRDAIDPKMRVEG